MKLIQLIMQLAVKKNAVKYFVNHKKAGVIEVKVSSAGKQMLTIFFESSLSKTFCTWSGGNLSMEVITLAIVCG